MTVWQLTRCLLWKMLSGQISPSSPVVREYGEWTDGLSNYKGVYFVDVKDRHVTPDRFPEPEGRGGSEEVVEINHQIYRVDGEGELRTVVVLD